MDGGRKRRCWFGEDEIQEGETFEDHDIEDGGRLMVGEPIGASIEEVASNIVSLNMRITITELIGGKRLKRNPDGTLHSWNLSRLELERLPGSIAALSFTGGVNLKATGIGTEPFRSKNLEVLSRMSVGGQLAMDCQ